LEQELLFIEKQERVCTLTLNRPERRNALSTLLLSQFVEILTVLKKEDQIRCLVLRGAGDKAFSAGLDFDAIPMNIGPETAEDLETKEPMWAALQEIINFPYPTIAMINGHAIGGGCELAATCDIRIARKDVRIGIPSSKLGVIYHPGGIMRFINLIGLANTAELFFTGRLFDADHAKEMGLLNYVLPPDQLTTFTYEMAREISENAPLSLKGLKGFLKKGLTYQSIDPAFSREMQSLRVEAFNSEDLKEAKRALSEKRKPIFQGK